VKSTLIIGGDPLSDKIIERLNRRYQTPYYWNIYGASKINSEEYEAEMMNGENVRICEDYISRSPEIIFTIPLKIFNEKRGEIMETLNRVMESIGGGMVNFTIAVYQHTPKSGEEIEKLSNILKDCKTKMWRIMYFGEIYGEKVNVGVVFEVLEKLKEDCMNIKIPLNPEEKRNYIYVDDAARAVLSRNIGAGGGAIYLLKDVTINNKTLLKRMTELIGVNGLCKINFDEKAEKTDPPNLPQPKEFKTKINIIDGLNRTIGWFEGEYGPIQVLKNNNCKF